MFDCRVLQRGFSLLELLVALVVFSIGLLAIAGLQTVSKQANFEGAQRTTASQIAYGLLEDIRTNGNAVDTYRTAGEFGGGRRGGEPAPNCQVGAECNAAEKAVHDLWFWEQMIDGNSGQFTVCDDRGEEHAKMLIIDLSGRPRFSKYLADGAVPDCP